jgi:hypothetical protein
MANKQFTDYVNERTADTLPNHRYDYLVIRKQDGTVKKVNINSILLSTISDDPIPTGAPPGVIDVTGVTDGTIIKVTGTDYIDNVVIDEGGVVWLDFQDSGGTLLNGTNLTVPGKTLTWSAGDMVEVVGLAGADAVVRQVVKASAGLSRPSLFHCRIVSTGTVDIATLNNGDVVNGTTVATNDIVLLPHQTATEQNGIYVIGATEGTTARHPLFDTYDSMIGVLFFIDVGPTYGNAPSIWASSSPAGGVIDVNGIDFEMVVGSMGLQTSDNVIAQFPFFGAWFKAAASSYWMILNVAGIYTTSRQFTIQLNDGNRTLDLGGNVTFTGNFNDKQNVDALLSSTQVNTNIGTKQNLYTVPATKKCIITKVIVRSASANLSTMGDSLLFGFTGSDYGSINNVSLSNLTGATLAIALTTANDTANIPFTIGNAADVFGCVFNDTSITATVQIDVFGYLY